MAAEWKEYRVLRSVHRRFHPDIWDILIKHSLKQQGATFSTEWRQWVDPCTDDIVHQEKVEWL